ncbi:MAG: tripartite tricarboxylate transporter TctB family protein [Acidaminobacteraceae bacterium]
MKIKIGTGTLSLALGVFYLINALGIKKASIGNAFAPKIFPIGLGILMILFSVILILKENKSLKPINFKAFSINSIDINSKLVVLTAITCIFYGLIFEKLGYVISTIVFLEIILTFFNGIKNFKTNTIVAVCFSVAIYFVFSNLLGIILPLMPILEI